MEGKRDRVPIERNDNNKYDIQLIHVLVYFR